MSTACGCEHDAPSPPPEPTGRLPWWRDPDIALPVASGVFLLVGLLVRWLGGGGPADVAAQVLFWAGLLSGAATFAPGAITRLVTRRALGIGLLMTISAVGAVLLGQVQEAAALAFLYSIAEALEEKAMARARSGLRSLLTLVPPTALVRRGGRDEEVAAAELLPGDRLVVRPGSKVATDGVVREGRSFLDTSAITGESIPVEVGPGDAAPAGSINGTGSLLIEATSSGTDNSLTTIVDLVEQAQAKRGDRARLADRIARPLIPGVLGLALLVAVAGSVFGDPGVWITRALVVLVAASPCALAISVPLTVVAGVGAASKLGIVVTSGAAFEALGRVRQVAIDKTGTLTSNRPTVTAIAATEGHTEAEVVDLAATLERHSSHPLAAAVVAASGRQLAAEAVTETAGHGLTGLIGGASVDAGSPRWLPPAALTDRVDELERAGMTVVMVRRNGTVIGAIGIRDELRPEAPQTVAELRRLGVDVTMLTGDNSRTAEAIAASAGIAAVRSELRPEDKARLVESLAASAPTAMIGDGINDAPALAAADVGIAMGIGGTDAAIESAGVAFMGRDLRLLPQALTHARRGARIMSQNIALSLLIIVTLLPLAITGVLGLAAVVLVHEVAEVLVLLNGLRAAKLPRKVGR